MPQRIIEWFKKPLEAVDLGHKVWDAILWIAAAVLPIAGPRLGIQSPTLATWIAVGSGLGGLLGYYATVIRFSGERRPTLCQMPIAP